MHKAIVVGINQYPDAPLQFCVDDATEVASLLRSREYGFAVECFFDTQATRKNLKTSIENALASNPQLLLFYFAGHGTASDLGGFLDTIDAEAPDEGLSLDLLRKYAEVRLPKDSSLIYVLDCCHSGIASVRSAATAPIRGDDVRRELSGLGGAGRVVLAACQEHELAYENRHLGHGAFTYFLIEGLSGYAADSEGEITAMSLYEYISRKFQASHVQRPVFSGDLAGRIVLGSGFTPAPRESVDIRALSAVEEEGEQLLSRFHNDLTLLKRDPSHWRAYGFRQACTSLEGLIRWFNSKPAKLKGLSSRERFRALTDDLRLRQAELCQLSPGMFNVEGEIIEAIGRGNFGTVWRVKRGTQEELAYKVFHPQDLADSEKVDRFRRGFHAMERLDHPRIVKVHRLTTCPYGYFMDYIQGSNLRKFVGTFDNPEDSLGLLITIAETLQHAHGRDVVHRDLKPENVLLTFDSKKGWKAYLTDFDLAWFSTATQITRSALGSTYYASPEQIDKPGSASARAKTTDMYSFGQVLYFTFCVSDPPRDGALQALSSRLRDGWSEEPARKLTTLFGQCTQYEPSRRPTDFRAIADEFALSGLGGELDVEQNSFISLSGKLHITVEVAERDNAGRIILGVHSLEAPTLPGTNHQRMRELLLARIGRAIDGIPNVQKRPGNQLPFHVFVELRDDLTRGGAFRAASVLGRVVDAIESIG